MTSMWLYLVVVMIWSAPVLSRPDGAPNSACGTMTPGHYGGNPQTGTSPYDIDIGVASTYMAGQKITVSIKNQAYKGILLQARKADGSSATPLGTWENAPANTKLKTCSNANDAVTHENTNSKIDLAYTWVAPSSDAGPVKFYATIAQEKMTYWVKQTSDSLTFNSAATPTEDGSATTTTTAPTTTTGSKDAGDSGATGYINNASGFLTVAMALLLIIYLP